MTILLVSVGTRGDMEPLMAIGEIMKEKGHRVTCAFPEQFRSLAEEANLEFASLGSRFIEMLESDVGKSAMGTGGSSLRKLLAIIKLGIRHQDVSKELVANQYKIAENLNPDRIVHNAKSIYPVIWAVNHPGKNVFISPVPYLHYVKKHTHVAFNSDFGEFFNKLTFKLADFGLVKTIMSSVKNLGIQQAISQNQISAILKTQKIIYTISPTLFPRPVEWKDNLQVLGYHDRKKTDGWIPGNELQLFLQKHKKLAFVTFGSMTNPEPKRKTQIILEVLEKNKIPAIINTASGGLVEPQEYNRVLFHFISRIPYDWIFPKVYAVIHHGGSGTTHLALKHGCVTMIIPHIIDQFVWNKIIHRQGVGVKGMKIGKLTAEAFDSKLVQLMNDPSIKSKAQQLGTQMQAEDYGPRIYQAIIGK